MDKALTQKDAPQKPVDETPQAQVASPKGAEPSPEETPRTYSQEQVDKLTHLASMKAGRDRKSIEEERDSLKTKVTDLENKILTIEGERESIQKQLDDLAGDDPNKFSLIKRDRELRDREKKLQNSLATHETEKKSYAQQIKDVQELDRLVQIYLVSEQFIDGNADKLAEACGKYGLDAEEEINSMAETLWRKKEEKTPPTMETDSGRTSGGSTTFTREQIDRMSIEEYIKLRPQIEAAQRAGKIK